MALTATIYRFQIELADTTRDVYQTVDLRVARHPSETAPYMLARVLAYCLRYEEGIELGRGISTAEEPALYVRSMTGELRAWIGIGHPAAERLHKASKTGARVYVYTHGDPAPLVRELANATIHRKEQLEIWALPAPVLDSIEHRLTRNERWSVTVSDGALYVTTGEQTFDGELERVALP